VYSPLHWDLHLPWLLMGYRFSTQNALGVASPYEMLYGKRALLPLRGQTPPELWRAPLPDCWDDPQAWAEALRKRAELYQLMLPAATEHLQAAQEKDRRRHASRSHDSSGNAWQKGAYKEGTSCTCGGPHANTRETDKAAPILRVHRINRHGGLELRGTDGELSLTEHTR